MYPITGGNIAPPTIDMMIRLLPSLVSLPRSLMPREKIVGNMIDIKKAIPITETSAIVPPEVIAIPHKTTLINA
ncbi:hypothetical protein D3C72_2268100 [compost metagenome]